MVQLNTAESWCSRVSVIFIGVDLGGSPGTCPPIIEKRPCIYHFYHLSPSILVFPPNIFDKSTPVLIFIFYFDIYLKLLVSTCFFYFLLHLLSGEKLSLFCLDFVLFICDLNIFIVVVAVAVVVVVVVVAATAATGGGAGVRDGVRVVVIIITI